MVPPGCCEGPSSVLTAANSLVRVPVKRLALEARTLSNTLPPLFPRVMSRLRRDWVNATCTFDTALTLHCFLFMNFKVLVESDLFVFVCVCVCVCVLDMHTVFP